MKKIIVGLILGTIVLNGFGQTLKYRHILDNGGVSLMTESQPFPVRGSLTLEYAIGYESKQSEYDPEGYVLYVYFITEDKDLYIPPKGRLLIKTVDEEVLQLEDNGEDPFLEYRVEYDLAHNAYRSDSYYDSSKGKWLYRVQGKFPVPKKDLEKMLEKGIIKIRIQTTRDAIQCEYNEAQGSGVKKLLLSHLGVVLAHYTPYEIVF